MEDSPVDFTLDASIQRRILLSDTADSSAATDRPSPAIKADLPLRDTLGSSSGKIGTGGFTEKVLFAHSFTQEFTQTQQDTATQRRHVDNAPVEVRDHSKVENIFDDDSVPLEVGHPAAHSQVESPPGLTTSHKSSSDYSPMSEIQRVPDTTMKPPRHIDKTPAGLTQFFASSQETPVVKGRKSAYISMKDSQEQREIPMDTQHSDEEDPDFPAVRKAEPKPTRSTVAHSVMDRLRDRSTRQLDSSPDQIKDFVPASAPIAIQSSNENAQEHAAIIVSDSQPNPALEKLGSNIPHGAKPDDTIEAIGVDQENDHRTQLSSPSSEPAHSPDQSAIPTEPEHSQTLREPQTSIIASIEDVQEKDPIELSSPVIQASRRRLRTRKFDVEASPVERPAKRLCIASSAPCESQDNTIAPTLSPIQIRRSARNTQEVQDTEPVTETVQVQEVKSTSGGRVSRSITPQTVKSSSPLTSLASQDFIQDTSPHHRPLPGKSSRSRRVLAAHPTTSMYQPATCQCIVGQYTYLDDLPVSVSFDHSISTDMTLSVIRPLQLQVNDAVKVNVPGMKSKRLIITALIKDPDCASLFTDIEGHTHFEARRKDNGQIARFPIDQLYLPLNMMRPFLHRHFSNLHVTSEPNTPSRRTARLREISPTLSYKSDRARPDGLFKNLAFAVTIQCDTNVRLQIEQKIRSHGGRIMTDGPQELFERTGFADYDGAPLRLTSSAASLHGAIVIADGPSRRSKYLQALALQLPCLHYSFIESCIQRKQIIDFRPFLLAAGEAHFGTHSAMMSVSCRMSFEARGLVSSLDARRTPLAKRNVIVVIGSDSETRKARRIHLFLAWAMGCSNLTQCDSLDEAHHLLKFPEQGDRWDIVSVQEAGDADTLIWRDLEGCVMTNEDVVQSLIKQSLVLR